MRILMRAKVIFILSFCFVASFFGSQNVTSSEGDVNGDGIVELSDAISALQIVTGDQLLEIDLDSDIDDSGRIGLPEAIVILKQASPAISNCNDGIDNDGDGYIDWQFDLGCVDENDDEVSGTRAEENGFTTFDVGIDSIVVYVSNSLGSDSNDGLSPATPVKTLNHAASKIRDGKNDFMLLRRGDTWRGESLGRFISGQDADHPVVISSYGEEVERPKLEINRNFIDHNGKARSHVAVVGLDLISYPKIPSDVAYDGETGGGFRYVGGGKNLLIEDCRLKYCELVVQSYGDYHYENVEVRRNVIEKNYHINTCGQNNTYRPSGMYASHVDGLTIEGNLFDHNGWNEDVPSACATMYNHNMYLNANNLVVRNNIIARASSMGIKMRSDTTGEVDNVLFENNFFVDGEIGIGIGGNTNEPYRFSNVIIRENVFSQIGLSNPSDRNFSWMLPMQDILTGEVTNNYFLHQPWFTNSYGIQLSNPSMSDVLIKNNVFYDLKNDALRVFEQPDWNGNFIESNTFVDQTHNSCLVNHSGDFSKVTYKDNQYYSSDMSTWFCGATQGMLPDWQAASGETGASIWGATYSDPGRTISHYSSSLGLQSSLNAFLEEAREQSRLSWDEKLSADAINKYIKEGFQIE